VRIVTTPAHNGGIAVARQRDRGALVGGPYRVGGNQLAALLAPGTAAAGEDPRRPGARTVARTAHEGGVAVVGHCAGPALCAPAPPGPDSFLPRPPPRPAAAGEAPLRPGPGVAAPPAKEGSVAAGRGRAGVALGGLSAGASTDELPLLGPDTAAAREDPHRPG